LLAWWTNREQSFRCYANETKGEMREIDREAEQSESGISDLGVIADLRAAGKRLGDSALTAAIRRVGWQAARDTQRCAVAEARVAQSAAQIDVLSRQRDEALARCRTGTPARLEHLAGQLKQVMSKLGETTRERDRLRIEVANLQSKLASHASAPAKPAESRRSRQSLMSRQWIQDRKRSHS
jgi:hypothetical protein